MRRGQDATGRPYHLEYVRSLTIKRQNVALADPGMIARLADLGAAPMPMTSADFSKHIAAEAEKWGKVVRAANIKVE
jgi:tripartite-type tricarboxylate transporter receptor subunit TctC